MSKRGMGTAALVVAGGVLASRVLGLLRDSLLAALLGRTVQGDVYQASFLIPDLLNYLMAGGYLSITFIPILSRHLVAGDEEEGWRAFAAVARVVGAITIALTALLMIGAAPLARLLYPRLDPAQLVEVTGLTRIVLPAQVFFVLGSLLMAVQYAHRRFVLPALAPVVYNLGIIGGGLVAFAAGRPSPAGFAWGALAGAALGNFGLQWVGARKVGLRMPAGSGWHHPSVGEYLALAFPLMIGQSIAVLDEQFTRLFGQLAGAGGITALSLARRLNMLPVGVVAQAAGVAAFPFLARLAEEGDPRKLADTTVRAIRHSVFAGCAAAAALLAVGRPAVRVVYQHGEFGAEDTAVVSSLLLIYALSIPAWALHQVVARSFYARRQMWTPVVVGTVMTGVAAALALPLFNRLGVSGLAWTSTIAITLYAALLFGIWVAKSGREWLAAPAISLGRSAMAGGAAALAGSWAAGRISSATVGGGAMAVLIGGSVVAVVFLAASKAARSRELAEILRRT